MNLTDCLNSNHFTSDLQCSQLGKSTRSFFWPHKVFLSCTDENHWKIVKLNPFQLLLRNFLGKYQSTHLDHVVNFLNKLEIDIYTDNARACRNRILDVWSKHKSSA